MFSYLLNLLDEEFLDAPEAREESRFVDICVQRAAAMGNRLQGFKFEETPCLDDFNIFALDDDYKLTYRPTGDVKQLPVELFSKSPGWKLTSTTRFDAEVYSTTLESEMRMMAFTLFAVAKEHASHRFWGSLEAPTCATPIRGRSEAPLALSPGS